MLEKINDNVVEIVSGREYQTKLPAGDAETDQETSQMESQFNTE